MRLLVKDVLIFSRFSCKILPKIRSIMTSQGQGNINYLNQQDAIALDVELTEQYKFSFDQLMELAGLGVATAIAKTYPISLHDRPIVCCGPGNNGGDGLVCARHLKLFGYSPTIIYPRPGNKPLFQNLLVQCRGFGIEIMDHVPLDEPLCDLGNLIVDSLFGFSFKPPNRDRNFAKLLNLMHDSSSKMPVVSVDIPSGWDVEKGYESTFQIQKDREVEMDLRLPALSPDCLISLTAPKLCAKYFDGRFHYLSGRFCPDSLQEKYKLNLPKYPGTECVVLLPKNKSSEG